MDWVIWIWIMVVWSVIGGFILVIAHDESNGAISMADGWEFVNPIHIHKYDHVNWFGALVVAIIYNTLCPIGAVIYWFYKLCTVGRD